VVSRLQNSSGQVSSRERIDGYANNVHFGFHLEVRITGDWPNCACQFIDALLTRGPCASDDWLTGLGTLCSIQGLLQSILRIPLRVVIVGSARFCGRLRRCSLETACGKMPLNGHERRQQAAEGIFHTAPIGGAQLQTLIGN